MFELSGFCCIVHKSVELWPTTKGERKKNDRFNAKS